MAGTLLERFTAVPTDQRRDIDIDSLYQKRPKRPNSPVYGEDELAECLRSNDLTSKGKFLSWYRMNPAAVPSLYRVRQVYGSWQAAKRAVFDETPTVKLPKTDAQIVRLVADLRIGSRRRYQALRNGDPVLYPSMHEVIKRFGRWSNVKRLACSIQRDNILTRYMLLHLQLGKWPGKRDCIEHGIEIDRLLGTVPLTELKELVLVMEHYGKAAIAGGSTQ